MLCLALGVGEEFDRLDVGIAVDDAAGHDRAGIGLSLGNLAQPGNEVAHHQHITAGPADQWQDQTPVGGADHQQGAEEVHRHIVEHVDQLDHAFAHRQRGLHQLGGDASGELVLIEAHGLAQQVAVYQPADTHGVVAHQRLEAEQGVDQDQ